MNQTLRYTDWRFHSYVPLAFYFLGCAIKQQTRLDFLTNWATAIEQAKAQMAEDASIRAYVACPAMNSSDSHPDGPNACTCGGHEWRWTDENAGRWK